MLSVIAKDRKGRHMIDINIALRFFKYKSLNVSTSVPDMSRSLCIHEEKKVREQHMSHTCTVKTCK